MRVALDLIGLQPRPVGVDRYMLGLLRGLASVDTETEYFVFVPRGEAERVGRHLPPNFEVRSASLRRRAFRLAFQQVMLPAAARGLRLDVVHSPGIHMPLVRGGAAQVVTIHDLTPISMPERHSRLRGSLPYRRMLEASMRRADRIIVATRFVMDDIRRRAAWVPVSRIRRIRFGIDTAFRPEAASEAPQVCARLGIARPYLLAVGTIEPRKNLPGLIAAYRVLVAEGVEEDLVIAGPRGWRGGPIDAALADPALRGRIHLTGYVPEPDLPGLYAGARVFAYPSFEEGFGFPPLEAMACGVPTVASANSALGENLAGAAELVEPGNDSALADALRKALIDDERRGALRRAGLERARDYRWDEAARRHVDVYREVA